jgi:hypothetical protein
MDVSNSLKEHNFFSRDIINEYEGATSKTKPKEKKVVKSKKRRRAEAITPVDLLEASLIAPDTKVRVAITL